MVTLIVRPPAPNRPQQSSPFLKLPPELRVIIYDMAARHSVDNAVEISVKMDLPVIFIRNTGGFALLHTCHTIRNESLDIVKSFLRLKADKFRTESNRLHTEGAISHCRPSASYAGYLTENKAISQIFARARILWIAADRLDRLTRGLGTRKVRSASTKRKSTFKLHSSAMELRLHPVSRKERRLNRARLQPHCLTRALMERFQVFGSRTLFGSRMVGKTVIDAKD